MRKHEQKTVFELLETLSEAINEIKKLSLRKETASIIQLLADSQDLAQALSDYVDGVKGEGTETVSLLEEYAKELYNASLEANTNGAGFIRPLRKLLYRIENCVRNELKPDKFEIAFLPYQLSMFDSMESVYLAAKADSSCDAYVIPIPYFDKNRDRSLGKMHCDGDMFPESIPITDWRQYKIEERKPDIIFIHNPYDEINFATSVHPDYYSKRLREQTELLCYVPYYIAIGGMNEVYKQCPGCVFAHKTFLPSENVRKEFISDYQKVYGNEFGKPADKFITLGSPKFDAVINRNSSDYTVPESWRRLISGADGQKKKVVLYNTSIGALLANKAYFIKLRYVLETFKNRGDVALWWRPHPLTEAIYQSMRSSAEFLEYVRLVEEYQAQGWGIYDDTPDPHRAIACTDAYYGDWGSMLALFRSTGKPIMAQDMETCKRSDSNLFFLNLHDGGESLVFVDHNLSILLKLNKTTWKTEWVCGLFKEGSGFALDLYGAPVEHNGALYFIPRSASDIAKYDLKTGELSYIGFEEDRGETKRYKFYRSYAYGDFIFFTPCVSQTIMRLNALTGELGFYSDWLEPLKARVGHEQSVGGCCVADSSIWFTSPGTNIVVEFNMETCTHHMYEAGQKDFGYHGIIFDGEYFWLTPLRDTTPLVKWNPQTGDIMEFNDLFLRAGEVERLFLSPVLCGGYIWLLPITAKHAIKINIHSNEISISEEFEANCRAQDGFPDWKYLWVQALDDSIYAYSPREVALVEYNCETKTWRKEKLQYPPEAEASLNAQAASKFVLEENRLQTELDCFYTESPGQRLEDYLNFLVRYGDSDEVRAMALRRAEIAQTVNVNANGTAGQAIYDYVKRRVFG